MKLCKIQYIAQDILARVRDVSIGLAFGLAVNIFVHPYANERQVLALLEKLREESLRALREITSFGRYPDLSACAHLCVKLEFELDQIGRASCRERVYVLV